MALSRNKLEEEDFDFLDKEVETQEFEDMDFEEKEPVLKKVGGEFLGTTFIVFAISLVSAISYIKFSSSAILVVAFTTAFVYSVSYYLFSRYSGGHFNPAITIGSMVLKTTNIVDGLFYISHKL